MRMPLVLPSTKIIQYEFQLQICTKQKTKSKKEKKKVNISSLPNISRKSMSVYQHLLQKQGLNSNNDSLEQDKSTHIEILRPATRADCVNGPRPCPWVSCRYHLYLDVSKKGSIKFNFPDKEVHELKETCALDVAEKSPLTLEEVGKLVHLTRERIRQVSDKLLLKLSGDKEALKLKEFIEYLKGTN